MLANSSPSTGPIPLLFSKRPLPFAVRGRGMTVSAAATVTTMYERLSVAETARPEEIKAAYRKQARQWHPDACPASGDKAYFAQQFMLARHAYEVLSDPALREGYDLYLRNGISQVDAWDVASGVVLWPKGGGRDRSGLGDWESQLAGLKKRGDARSAHAHQTWGSRMRSGDLA